MKLIDADALIDALCRACSDGIIDDECYGGGCGFMYIIKSMPKIDAEPVRHGKWLPVSLPDANDNAWYECSVCGTHEEMATGAFHNNEVKRCWKCGAKMDG